MRRLLLVMGATLVALSAMTAWAAPTPVTVSGREILVNGNPFIVKGVNYSPVPIGESPGNAPFGDYFTAGYSAQYTVDLSYIRYMKANTVRLWTWDGGANHVGFLDAAYNGGTEPIYVIATYNLPDGLDLSDSTVRNDQREAFRAMVQSHRDHAAVLMWAIGNGLDATYSTQLDDLFGLVEEMAQIAHAEDANHPVMMPLADDSLVSTYDSTVPTLDVWGANVYRGSSFGTLFADYETASTKPFVVTEFGIDNLNNDTGKSDGTNQAAYAESLWGEIETNATVCSGGIVSSYVDEWWRGELGTDPLCTDTDPAVHTACGTVWSASPDNYDNKEWWGLLWTITSGINVGDRYARPAYFSLQTLFGGGATAKVTSVSLTADKTSPMMAGKTATFTALATGGSGSYEYQYIVKDPGNVWSVVRNYSTAATWQWTPATVGYYVVEVYARNAGSPAVYEAFSVLGYTVLPGTPATGVTLTPSKASPSTAGTTVRFTAAGSGGSGLYEYRFITRSPSGVWTTERAYSTDNTWAWTPTTTGTYTIEVDVRNAGSTAYAEAYKQTSYAIVANSPATGVTLTPSTPSPVMIGAAITFTALGSGGSGNYQYQFNMRNPSGVWTVERAYGTGNTWAWTPAVTGTYVIEAYARIVGSSAYCEAHKQLSYTILVNNPATGATLTANRESPVTIGLTTTFTAQGSGGSGNYEYRYNLRNPSGAWTVERAYSPVNTWAWTPTATGSYVIEVNVRCVGSPANYDVYKTMTFVVNP